MSEKLAKELKAAREKVAAFRAREEKDAKSALAAICRKTMNEFLEVCKAELDSQAIGLNLNFVQLRGRPGCLIEEPDYRSGKLDLPHFAWAVQCNGFKDGVINVSMISPTEIYISGGNKTRWDVHCLNANDHWSFVKVDHRFHKPSSYEVQVFRNEMFFKQQSVNDIVISLDSLSAAIETVLMDAIWDMGNESSKV